MGILSRLTKSTEHPSTAFQVERSHCAGSVCKDVRGKSHDGLVAT